MGKKNICTMAKMMFCEANYYLSDLESDLDADIEALTEMRNICVDILASTSETETKDKVNKIIKKIDSRFGRGDPDDEDTKTST